MGYLKSLQQIDDEVKEDERLIQSMLFRDDEIIDTPLDVYSICPICKRNYLYKDWWTCKGCGKHLSVEEYTRHLIKNFSI